MGGACFVGGGLFIFEAKTKRFLKLKLLKNAAEFIQASNEKNLASYLTCFTKTALIDDVSKPVKGKTAIADWFTSKDYEYQMEPTGMGELADRASVKTKVTGTFKGSPLIFVLQMKLDSGSIHCLKIDVAG